MNLVKLTILIATIITALTALWLWNTRPQTHRVNVPIAADFPETGFSHRQFETLLQQFVDDEGNVNYEAWYRAPTAIHQLKQYLAAIETYSPDTSPQRFASEQDELAYWIYSYNALVIHSILIHWPLNSVTDVKAPIEIVKGLGFFYNQEFVIGGKTYNLHDLEQQKMVKANRDPRLHFALNCGSASCPPMRPQLPVGIELEFFLQQAAIEFINDPENVRINPQTRALEVSQIFNWYRQDFAKAAREKRSNAKATSQEQDLVNYILQFADDELTAQIESAKAYPVTYIQYDWSINNSQASDAGESAGHRKKTKQ